MTVSKVITSIIVAACVVLIFAVSWNYVMPYLFGLPAISFAQAMALLCIVRIPVFMASN